MKNTRFPLALIGGLLGLAISFIAITLMVVTGFKWGHLLILPGHYVGGMVFAASSSIILALIAGFRTMTLLGAVVGYLVGVLISLASRDGA